MLRACSIPVVLTCLVASPLLAEPISPAVPPSVVRLFAAPLPAQVVSLGALPRSASQADTLVYDNSSYIPAWFDGGAGIEYADDLHMTRGGPLSSLIFGYYHDSPNPVGIVLRIYRNTAQNDSLLELVAGPYIGVLSQPSPGPALVQVVPEDRPILPEHLWFSVAFNTGGPGLIFADPPRIGSSDNLYFDFAAGRVQTEIPGFQVPLNWYVRIRVELPVAVEQTTWTRVKHLYASP